MLTQNLKLFGWTVAQWACAAERFKGHEITAKGMEALRRQWLNECAPGVQPLRSGLYVEYPMDWAWAIKAANYCIDNSVGFSAENFAESIGMVAVPKDPEKKASVLPFRKRSDTDE